MVVATKLADHTIHFDIDDMQITEDTQLIIVLILRLNLANLTS